MCRQLLVRIVIWHLLCAPSSSHCCNSLFHLFSISPRRIYSHYHTSEAKRLKELEKENNRLKKLLAEVMLDNQILKDI